MTRWGVIRLLSGGIGLLVLGGCAELFPNTYRFKLTVEVETPGGLRSGSAVYEVSASNTSEFLPDAAKRTSGVKGQAVAVDIAPGKTLFALLKTDSIHADMAGLSMTALDPAFKNDIVESAARIRRRQGISSPAQVMQSNYPLLVTFSDVRDPKTVERVDPADLAVTFGPGVTLRSITVAVTQDPVTTGIEKQLEWLPAQQGSFQRRLSSPDPTNPPLAATLNRRDFSTEIGK